MSRCDVCPVSGPTCAGTSRPSLCGLVATGNPLWIRHVAGLSVAQAAPPAMIPAIKRTDVRTYHAATLALLACPYRDHRCGCDLPTCHAGYGDHDDGKKASREHCLACLRTTWGLI